MRGRRHAVWLALAAMVFAAPLARPVSAQRVVDQIIVRIEDDIITSSEMQELAAYQELVDQKPQQKPQLLAELIEQWVVNTEASAAHFPPPAESEVTREVERIRDHYPSPQAYQARLVALDITPDTVRRTVARQLFLARYLDYKFRPSVQVDDAAIAKYYQDSFAPALAARNQTPPPVQDVREQVRELLVQQGINDRAATWIEETKSHLNIEVQPAAAPAPASATP